MGNTLRWCIGSLDHWAQAPWATFEPKLKKWKKKKNALWTRIHWLDQRIVRKQLDIMPTYHYVQNQEKLMIQSRENGQKPHLGKFLTISRSSISKLQIFLKNRFHSNWKSYLVLTSDQKPKKSSEPFLRNVSKCPILS